jgi:N-methylhydantoinase A
MGVFGDLKLIGIDTGGTFTDFVFYDGVELRVHKVLSTPDAPERSILQGIREMGLESPGMRAVHGTTVATNAVLEGKGVRTVYIANHGLGDLLSIGRQARRELYDLQPQAARPPVPAELCLEVGGRLDSQGRLLQPLSAHELTRLGERLVQLAPRAVAINLLFSYLDDSQERALEAVVPEGVFVSRSSRVLPEIREYERGMATWLNAWVGPLVEGYLQRLSQGLQGARVAVMQSSGETILADQAGQQAVRMLLSGPAGGLVGARFVAGLAGRERLLSFDMGGTSTDVALIDGEPRLTNAGRIGPYPVGVPMVDMHTIGAGGGSIARLDAGGMLQVGPESAGAAPGPACYGQGGREPTVTDANLLLGRLQADAFLGGAMELDLAAAQRAMAALAAAMGCTAEDAALGIVRVANEHMTRALRVISVQRGVDPRGFTLTSFGGAGGLHVCALAEALGMRHAMVPIQAGVLSALGMLATRSGRQLSRTWLGRLDQRSGGEVQERLLALEQGGRRSLEEEGVVPQQIEPEYSLDLRYQGQSYTLNVPWSGIESSARVFGERHQDRYGHRMDLPVELVNLRVALRAGVARLGLVEIPTGPPGEPVARVSVYGMPRPVPRLERAQLTRGQAFSGPALITETVATTWVAPGWRCEVDSVGNLLLEREL